MNNYAMSAHRLPSVLLLALALGACMTPAEEPASDEPAPKPRVFADHSQETLQRQWTTEFQGTAVFVADEVMIDGPSDLVHHIAIEQDPEVHRLTTRTVKEGLRQEVTLAEGTAGREVRAQLDGWNIVAMRRLVVLQRPGDAPVRVVGTGNAALLRSDGEQRATRLEFRGDHGTR